MAVSADAIPAQAPLPVTTRPPGRFDLLRRSLRQRRMQIGLVVTGLVVFIAIFGPAFAPYSPGDIVTTPYSTPSAAFPLGGDYLGHDVWSCVLNGGRTVVLLSLAATGIGMVIGVVIGLIAGYSRSALDDVVMGGCDVVLAFPQIVLVLVFVSILGPKIWLIVLIVGVSHSPRIARLTRSTTLELIKREFIENAELIGIPRRKILLQEILPNLTTPLLVEFGLRLTWSVGLIAGLSFLGYGIQPPTADWGLMINQNRPGLTINVWAALAPMLCIFLFATGTNLMTEGVSRAVARVEGGRQKG
jgi:peptide/nickel transport system permease protein